MQRLAIAILGLLPLWGAGLSERLSVRDAGRTVELVAGQRLELPLDRLSSDAARTAELVRSDTLVDGAATGRVLVWLNERRDALVVSTNQLAPAGRHQVSFALTDAEGRTLSGALDIRFLVAPPLPRTERVPVILINGYQSGCAASASPSTGTFGQLQQLLQADGVSVFFFDNCVARPSPTEEVPIERLGNELNELLTTLRYSDGTSVPQADIIAHSMGGLIVRSYLAGKRAGEASYAPPAAVRIRKFITLSTPHFGAILCTGSVQASQLCRGSRFTADLATWNQGYDDLRGIDYLAVAGNAAGGASDGIVSVVSAAGGAFRDVDENRTRILPYCHTTDALLTFVGCPPPIRGIANVTGPDHLTWQLVRAFLRDDPAWRGIGETPRQSPAVRERAGLYATFRDEQGVLITPDQVVFQSATGSSSTLNRGELAYQNDTLSPGPGTLIATTGGREIRRETVTLLPGSTTVLESKAGPRIALVLPSTNQLNGLARAPRMLVTLYGINLAAAPPAGAPGLPLPTTLGGTAITFAGRPVGLLYTSPNQINAYLPEDAPLYGTLTLTRTGGSHSIGLLAEPASPSLFTANSQGTGLLAAQRADFSTLGPNNPTRSGEIVILYGTGLGTAQPTVTATIGGRPARVLFSGAVAGFVGLDQFNVEVPAGLAPGDVEVQVQANGRRSNTGTIPIR